VVVSFHAPGRRGHGTTSRKKAAQERDARVAAQWALARQLEASGIFHIPAGVVPLEESITGRPAGGGGGGGGGAGGGGGGSRGGGGGSGGGAKRGRPRDFEADKEATATYARQAAAAERKLKEYEAQLLEDSL
jgi:hypothetical protein